MPDWDMNGDVTVGALRAQALYAVQALADMERERDELKAQIRQLVDEWREYRRITQQEQTDGFYRGLRHCADRLSSLLSGDTQKEL